MTAPTIAPYGSWKSPITADFIVGATIGLGQMSLDGADTYWNENRPAEAGRTVLVCRTPDGRAADVTPPPFNVRSRVHEYGGGSYTVADGVVYFSNFTDQRLYRVTPGAEPQPITPEGAYRYADGVVDQARGRMYCVREDHSGQGEAVNTLVSVALARDDVGGTVLASGNDFYASPRLSPDGSRLAWLTWRHPNMPWDGCELWVAEIAADGALANAARVAGGTSESIFQPEWSPDGRLHFVSDRSGWWNLYRLGTDGRAEPLHPMEAEFGLPQWVFAMSTYGFESAGSILCTYSQGGRTYLARLDTASGALAEIETPYTAIVGLRVGAGRAVFSAASPTERQQIVQMELASGQMTVLRRSSEAELDPGYISLPEEIAFPTEHGLTAFGFFYPSRNRDYVAPQGELPPLLVMSHGGPTSATDGVFSPSIQFWTSRGIAVLDVNYGGSTGYGRAYRERLNGQWGVVDVDDCANGAKYLVERGRVDGNRLAITGGSAGGYTTLCALTFRDTFKAGASHFGISDLEALSADTHKFESRYDQSLVGPLPESRELYRQRSPIHYTDRLSCPVIFFQGLDDKVVPPNQAELMVAALRAKGLPVAYVAFEGEGHGFRRAENIKRALEGELYFYSRVFGFPLAEPITPVEIVNM
jgi:dipeptidyl aminopeptidase/acylaminoacyl peptidase